ncbi:MAG TPA: Flp pilus assembly protein CpaB [Solimonas sp.]|nr:Flp pilus assembly protein CpaB [Solimonas sp.]
MSSTTLKIVAVVAVLFAVILAVVGYKYSRSFAEKAERAQQAEQERQKQQQTLAVVALKPLQAYKPIPRDSLALVPVVVPPMKPYTSIDQVVDKAPLIDIDAGAPVTERYFTSASALSRAVPEGFKAVSVEVNDVVAVGGFIRPGDIVDVLLFLRPDQNLDQAQSRVLLEGVRVLAYQEMIIDRPEGVEEDPKDKSSRKGSSRVRTAVLAVSDKDTTKLMLGASAGELRLALHGGTNEGDAPTDQTAAGLPVDESVRPVDRNPERAISIKQLAKPGTTAVRNAGNGPEGPSVQVIRGAENTTVIVK